MPAESKSQKTLFCMALAVKEGKLSPTYSKKAKQMADSMSKKDLEEFCHSEVKK